MFRLFDSVAHDHDHLLLAAAVAICLIGSGLAVRLSRRMMLAEDRRRRVQLALTALIAGTTIWATHFIGMLAFDPRTEHSYEPIKTGLSIVVAIVGVALANAFLGWGQNRTRVLAGGCLFGLTIAIMHYLGMAAYTIPGRFVWDTGLVAASVALGVLLGMASYHRIVFPVTRYCWLGGTLFMVLAIASMHFTGMAALTIELDPSSTAPTQVISDTALALLMFGMMVLVMLLGFAAVSIEANIEHEANIKLQVAALNDPLTDLPNRLHLGQRVEQYADDLLADPKLHVAVLTIDLAQLKWINDIYGHATGDDVIRIVSKRMKTLIGAEEFIARSGGDEFVILKRGFTTIDAVVAFGERLNGAITQPIDLPVAPVVIEAAIGIATNIDQPADMKRLLGNSDIAMHRAKSDPSTFLCTYDAEMDRKSQEKSLLIHDLRHAIARGEFSLVYQLQNELGTLEATGFEVLLRWNHPIRGPVSPGEFIPLAEETGLIRDIGMWVLETACAEAATWSKPLSIAVNVAPQQLVQPGFVDKVGVLLSQTGLPAARLELEVTEASIIEDQTRTLRAMHALKDMGIRIAMDDFGTGYSSLSTLQSFPFDKIKIDRSFITDIHQNHQRIAIVRSTLLLGAALDIPVLAEGVEDEQELAFLRTEGCAFVQGFYFGRPKQLQEARAIANAPRLARAG